MGTCEQKSVLASVGGGEPGYRLHYLPCDGVLGRWRSNGNLSVLTDVYELARLLFQPFFSATCTHAQSYGPAVLSTCQPRTLSAKADANAQKPCSLRYTSPSPSHPTYPRLTLLAPTLASRHLSYGVTPSGGSSDVRNCPPLLLICSPWCSRPCLPSLPAGPPF